MLLLEELATLLHELYLFLDVHHYQVLRLNLEILAVARTSKRLVLLAGLFLKSDSIIAHLSEHLCTFNHVGGWTSVHLREINVVIVTFTLLFLAKALPSQSDLLQVILQFQL